MRCEKCHREFESPSDFAEAPNASICLHCFTTLSSEPLADEPAAAPAGSVHPSWRIVAMITVLLLLVCAASWGIYRLLRTEDSMVIVDGNHYSIAGEIEVRFDVAGNAEPVIVKEGRLVLFRTDQTITGGTGRAGEAYRWDDDLKLRHVGSFDLALSNDQLYEKYRLLTANAEE